MKYCTLHQYEVMLRMYDGGCWICGRLPKNRRLAADHDHKTGRVRGLLCYPCNRFLVGKHTLETARQVVAYLEHAFDGRSIVNPPLLPKRKGTGRPPKPTPEHLLRDTRLSVRKAAKLAGVSRSSFSRKRRLLLSRESKVPIRE